MSADANLPLLLAAWLETRLHESIGFALRGWRLYGLEIVDADDLEAGEETAVRSCFLAGGDELAEMHDHPEACRVADFDAAGLVIVDWRSIASGGPPRPGEFALRRRARVVHVTTGEGSARLVRFEHDPEHIVVPRAS